MMMKNNSVKEFQQLIIPHEAEVITRHIDKDTCKICGGLCCKRMGCEISPMQVNGLSITGDIKANTKLVKDLLETGIVSIDWWIANDGKHEYYLRMRNVGCDIIDPGVAGRCIALTSNGCAIDDAHRPMAGLSLKCVIIDGDPNKRVRDPTVVLYTKEMCKTDWAKYPIDWNDIIPSYGGESTNPFDSIMNAFFSVFGNGMT